MNESTLITELRGRIERLSKQASADCRTIAELREERAGHVELIAHKDRTISLLYEAIETPTND